MVNIERGLMPEEFILTAIVGSFKSQKEQIHFNFLVRVSI
jgi:hypothetical protein